MSDEQILSGRSKIQTTRDLNSDPYHKQSKLSFLAIFTFFYPSGLTHVELGYYGRVQIRILKKSWAPRTHI